MNNSARNKRKNFDDSLDDGVPSPTKKQKYYANGKMQPVEEENSDDDEYGDSRKFGPVKMPVNAQKPKGKASDKRKT